MTTSAGEVLKSSADLDVVVGVDTHADTHHVAILSVAGARLGDRQVPATATSYEQLLSYVRSFGGVRLVGIEGTSSYGAGLSWYLRAQHVDIREIVRPRRSQRRRGKSDPIDAAQQALAAPDALPLAKTGDGLVEQIRVLLTVRRSAIKARVAVIRQIKSLLVTAPEPIRMRWAGSSERRVIEDLVAARPGAVSASVSTATAHALRRLARRHQYLTGEVNEVEEDLRDLVARAAPARIATKGYGVITTATLLVTAGSYPCDSDQKDRLPRCVGLRRSPPPRERRTGSGSTVAGTGTRTGPCPRSLWCDCPMTGVRRTTRRACRRTGSRRPTSFGDSNARSPGRRSISSSTRACAGD